MSVQPPAPRPCGSCPYRRDVPSGVWAPEEYAKLPLFDGPTATQEPSVFLCHQQDGRLCAGWAAVHDMEHSLGLRLAVALGTIAPEDVDAVYDYTTDVELWPDGGQAAAHGMREVERPGDPARRLIDRLDAKRAPGV